VEEEAVVVEEAILPPTLTEEEEEEEVWWYCQGGTDNIDDKLMINTTNYNITHLISRHRLLQHFT
jgi:hypothetical protein